jgi:VanZ family protein
VRKIINLIVFITLLIAGIALDLAPIEVPAGIDKVYHFIGFFVITISAIITYISFFGTKFLNYFIVLILTLGGLCAGLSEDAQKLIPIRGCDVTDWLTNLGGIGLACVFLFLLNSKIQRKKEE